MRGRSDYSIFSSELVKFSIPFIKKIRIQHSLYLTDRTLLLPLNTVLSHVRFVLLILLSESRQPRAEQAFGRLFNLAPNVEPSFHVR